MTVVSTETIKRVIKEVHCPNLDCRALPGKPCKGADGKPLKGAVHSERGQLWSSD